VPDITVARQSATNVRIERALERLDALGNPGLQSRQVPGLSRRLPGKVVEVRVEPAWPIGAFRWTHRNRGHRELETGYTPKRHVVPMCHAAESDDVDEQFRVLTLDLESITAGYGRRLEAVDIAAALERLARRAV
jgi:hypothetical protein